MAADFSETGVFNVNGQWATSVKYEVDVERGAMKAVHLRFVNGRSEVAKASVSPAEAQDLLGEKNFERMAVAAKRKEVDPPERVGGELKGKNLEFRQVTLNGYEGPATENAIALDSRTKRPDEDKDRARLNARDVVVGIAHGAQLANIGGAAMHTAAQAVGVVDAAKIAKDAVDGKEVRPVDALAAASSLTMTAGVGGPAVQTVAKAGAALGAIDTATRAARTAEDAGEKIDSKVKEQIGGAPSDAKSARVREEEEERQRSLKTSGVPDAVSQRFLKVDDKYYFPDKTLAFVDRGTKLKAETHNVEVVRSIVSIAETRDWQALTVTGTKDFRREVWREAALRGIDVRGYEPTELERQELRRSMEKRNGPNEIAREAPQRARPPVDAPEVGTPHSDGAPRSSGPRNQRRERDNVHVGVLVEAGAAPYKFDPKETDSYYVKLKTERGERVVWGVDLERALAESQSQVKVGDVVGVESRGAKSVMVKVPVRDDQGAVVGEKEQSAKRNAWVIEKKEYFDSRTEKAQALRSDAPRAELVRKHPDMVDAAVTLWVGEQFAKQIERKEDRERVVSMVRERLAEAVERGETIHAPRLKKDVALRLDAERARIPAERPSTTTPTAISPERHAADGARLLANAMGMSLSASYADDSKSAEREKATAARMESQAYRQLAVVDVERAKELVALERQKHAKDPQLAGSITLNVDRHRAAQREVEIADRTIPPRGRVPQEHAHAR